MTGDPLDFGMSCKLFLQLRLILEVGILPVTSLRNRIVKGFRQNQYFRMDAVTERRGVISSGCLTYDSQLFRSIRLPDADIHFIRSAEDVLIVRGPCDGCEPLHALRIINFPAASLLRPEDADRLVVGPGYKFFPGGGVVDIDHR